MYSHWYTMMRVQLKKLDLFTLEDRTVIGEDLQ